MAKHCLAIFCLIHHLISNLKKKNYILIEGRLTDHIIGVDLKSARQREEAFAHHSAHHSFLELKYKTWMIRNRNMQSSFNKKQKNVMQEEWEFIFSTFPQTFYMKRVIFLGNILT